MSLTITIKSRNLSGHRREVVADFVFDDSYPNTGGTVGEPLTPATLGLEQIETCQVVESPDGYVFSYDRANAVLHAFYSNDDGGADGPLIEVANGANLSSVNGRLVARGN